MMNRVNELEQWLKVLRRCAAYQVNFDMWNDRASSFASPEERERMHAEDAQSRREQADAERELEALIIKTRVDDPAALERWISMHEEYAPDERAAWNELRSGKRNLLYEFGRWPSDRDRYSRIFGSEP